MVVLCGGLVEARTKGGGGGKAEQNETGSQQRGKPDGRRHWDKSGD
eukprot:SAG11_NODE_24226_length_376_cov_1.306859_1_plen_45_part_10